MKKRFCLTFIIQEIYNARFVPCHHKPSATLIVHTFLLRHATFDNAAHSLPAHICCTKPGRASTLRLVFYQFR